MTAVTIAAGFLSLGLLGFLFYSLFKSDRS